MSDFLDIAVVNTMPFPSGFASVNRILSYSRGLVELGDNVVVYSTAYGDDFLMKKINGISYINMRRKSFSLTSNFFSIIFALFRLIYHLLNSKHRYIILVTNSLFLIYPMFLVAKIKGIKFLLEKSEFPFMLKRKSFLGFIYKWFYIHTTYKLFDGMIIMTYPLDKYFAGLTRKKCKRIIIPMTVEPERFNIAAKNEMGSYIAYCGDISDNKDGVMNLIISFSMIEETYPQLKLLLIGGSKNPKEKLRLIDEAKKLGTKNVHFYGQVERDQIPPLLCNAKLLALARPSSLQSTGGFPTKLGEYLSTGNPTIVTKVGDIPLYLSDGENAFLVEPNDVKAFAQKISYVLNNYDKAKQVAQNGKNLVLSTFNYKFQSKRLHNFLIDLIN